MKTQVVRHIIVSLASAGLWLTGTAQAQIALHDGSLRTIRQQTNGSSSISTNFTVTSGASVLVVLLYDQNNVSTDKSPSSLTWGSQTLTKAVGEDNSRSTYADSDIFYLFNPNAGTQTITATDTSGSNVLAMAIQVYTLSGVNTSVSPVAYATNAAYATNSLVTLSSSTPAGAWAVVSANYGYNGNGNYLLSTSGTTNYAQVQNPQVPNYQGDAVFMGGVSNLAAGATTISLGNAGSGGVQQALAAAVFAPGVANVTPQFSNLSSHTISYGTTNVTLTGTVSTNSQYLPNGTVIKATINSNTQQTTIDDSTGDFSLNYNSTGFATNVYTVTYTSAAATGFNPATNTSTTLTVNKATPTLTAPTASSITYGQTLASSTLSGGAATNANNGAAVAGSFAFTTPSLMPTNTGSTNVSVTFTPTNTPNYNNATTTVGVTVNPLPVVLSGSMVANGTTTVPASDLTVANLVGSDNLTLSGSVQIAGTNVGPQNITSFSGLTLGGTAAAKYTLTGASGSVTLTAGGGSGPILLHDGSLTNIRQQTNGSSSISTNFTVTSGAGVLVVLLYDQNNVSTDKSPSSLTWGSQTLTKAIGENNSRSTYADSDIFYLFNPNPGTQTITATDTSGSNVIAMAIQVYTLSGVNTSVSPVAYATNAAYATNSLVTLSSSTPAGAWAVVSCNYGYQGNGVYLLSTSGTTNYAQVQNTQVPNYQGDDVVMGGITNLAAGVTTISVGAATGGGVQQALAVAVFTPGSGGGVTNVTPQFSNLSSHTIPSGTTNVTLTGTVSTNSQYLPNGTAVTVTINGNGQGTTIDDSTGDFSINYNTTGFATNVYTVTYVSAAATGFNAATNTSTTLTITAAAPVTPQFSGLSSPTTTYGTTDVSLSGTVSTNGQYLPNGTTITVSVDGNAQQTSISGSMGDFNIGYDTVGIPASATPYTVTYKSAAASGFNPATNTSTTMTINKLPVVLSGSMVANGTTTVPAADLTVANLVDSDNLTLSGSVQIAGTNVGPENITSFSGLTLGGSSAANYTLTGASGSVTLTSPGQSGLTNWIGIFKSASDIDGWVDGGGDTGTGSSASLSFAAGDAPPSGPSTGALVATVPVTASGTWIVIGTNVGGLNLTNYTQLEFDVKVSTNQTEWNVYGNAFNSLIPIIEYGTPSSLTVDDCSSQQAVPVMAAYNGWQHWVIPASDFGATANLSSVQWFQLEMNTAALPASGTVALEFANIKWDSPPPPAATVSVNANSTVRTADTRWLGVNTTVWCQDFNLTDGVPETRKAGWTTLRFPGGDIADFYFWNISNSVAPYNTYRNFATVATNLGDTVMISVNYGTGTPAEAAAWVADANLTNHYGFKYWEIGNEVYAYPTEVDSNTPGHDPWEYGQRAATYITQMKAVDPSIKVGVVMEPNSPSEQEDPGTNSPHYATNLITGQVVSGWGPVVMSQLRQAGVTPDFAIYHDYPQNYTENDQNLLSLANWTGDCAELSAEITQYLGPAGSNVEVCVTENNCDESTPGKQVVSLVNALYYCDSLGQIAQTPSINNRMWWDYTDSGPGTGGDLTNTLYGWREYGDLGTMMPGIDEPLTNRYPVYFAAELASHFVGGGDTVVQATSGNPLVTAYAAVRTNGNLTLMLINKSLTLTNYAENITLNGFTPASTATVYSYGIPQDNQAKAANNACDITTNTISVGTNFNYTIEPYSINVINFVP